MNILLTAALVFFVGYLLNIFYITVLYHRALTHGAVTMTPLSKKFCEIHGKLDHWDRPQGMGLYASLASSPFGYHAGSS